MSWTSADYDQLIGRIRRSGQVKDQIDVIIPLTFVMLNGERRSWCESRLKRIEFKKSIAGAAVDGVIPEGYFKKEHKEHKNFMAWLNRLDSVGVHEIERRKIDSELSDSVRQPALRRLTDLSRENQRINNESSQDTHHNRFLKNPAAWHEYHASFRENRKSWEVVPSEEALKWCQERPELIIGDFGCGEALLVSKLKNKVHSFDHVAINENVVIACDMAQIPLEDETIDVAVFSLSLMGTNFVDYLKQAKRCLRRDGWLWVAEPTSRIKDNEQFKELLKKLGFHMIEVEVKDRFTFVKALKSDREINDVAVRNLLKERILGKKWKRFLN